MQIVALKEKEKHKTEVTHTEKKIKKNPEEKNNRAEKLTQWTNKKIAVIQTKFW